MENNTEEMETQYDSTNASVKFHDKWLTFCQWPTENAAFRKFCDLQSPDDVQNTTAAPWPSAGSDVEFGNLVYVYVIPIILAVGLSGNIISLIVFSRPQMKTSASCYLTVLCASDIIMLITFVGIKYIDLGLPYLTGVANPSIIAINGVCQAYVYIVHVCRAVSAWIIVVFSMERYVAVCMPLRRREICRRSLALKCLGCIILISAAVSIYKPMYSSVEHIGEYAVCCDDDELINVLYILDMIYGNLVTLIPFILIAAVNIGILRALLRHHQNQNFSMRRTHTYKLRREFTIILLGVSLCFMCFNLPYYIVWSLNSDIYRQQLTQAADFDAFGSRTNSTEFVSTNVSDSNGGIRLTRTIFSVNYCTNFLLYCITGSYYRAAVAKLCQVDKRDRMSSENSTSIHTTHLLVTNLQTTEITDCSGGKTRAERLENASNM